MRGTRAAVDEPKIYRYAMVRHSSNETLRHPPRREQLACVVTEKYFHGTSKRYFILVLIVCSAACVPSIAGLFAAFVLINTQLRDVYTGRGRGGLARVR
jgi:hypothetical protein